MYFVSFFSFMLYNLPYLSPSFVELSKSECISFEGFSFYITLARQHGGKCKDKTEHFMCGTKCFA